MSLTPEQIQILRATVQQYGVLNMAAHSMGINSRMLKALIAKDPDLKAEVDEAMEDHRESLYATAVKRAVGRQADAHGPAVAGSDPLLGKLLEAQMPTLFDPKARNAALTAQGRPTGVTLRQFTENDDGNVVDVEPKSAPVGPQQERPASASAPLQLEFDGRVRI